MPRQGTDFLAQGAQLVPDRGQFCGPSQLGLVILRVAADEEGGECRCHVAEDPESVQGQNDS